MKKYLISLLYKLIFLSANFTGNKIDAYAKNVDKKERPLVEIKSISNVIENDLKEEEKKILEQQEIERQQEEAKKQSYNVVQTSSYYTPTVTYGTYGRLFISGFNVALYDYNVNTNSNLSLQQIVDNSDSAAFYASRNRLVIADHDTQGFSVLTWISEGTTSYIQFEDGSTISYRLVRKAKGYNTGPDLVDTEGNSFFNMDSDIIMYTCYDGGIMVTLWSLL